MSSSSLSMSLALQRFLQWVGSGLAVIGIVFVAARLHSYWIDIDFSRVTPLLLIFISVFSLLYGAANLLLALGWWHLLRHLGSSVTRLGSIRIYGISQLAKYVPGNIFHLAGRQALGMVAGISVVVLVKSTVWELALIAIAGTLFGWLILPLILPSFPEEASLFLLLGSVVIFGGLLQAMFGRQPACTFMWQIFFLVVSGSLFVALLHLIAGGDGFGVIYWLMIGGAYITAWLVGLVTPGAPAGVGIREIILLLLLKGIVAEFDLLMAVLLGRLVTVAGDLLFFVTASFIPKKLCEFDK